MSDVVVTLAISRNVLMTSNSRLHWAEKARRTRVIRDMAHILCKHEHRHTRLEMATLVVETRWPDRRIRDADNVAPMSKAAIDGVVQAGLLADDNSKILLRTAYEIGEVKKDSDWVACWLRLTFTPVEPADTNGGA